MSADDAVKMLDAVGYDITRELLDDLASRELIPTYVADGLDAVDLVTVAGTLQAHRRFKVGKFDHLKHPMWGAFDVVRTRSGVAGMVNKQWPLCCVRRPHR